MSAKAIKVSTFTVKPFDYGLVDADASDFARQAVGRIKGHERAAAVDIGRELIAVKDRLGHGHFLAWIEAEFGWSRRTATNMMQVAQEFGDDWEKIAHLPRSLQYQIASPSAPQAIRDAIRQQGEGAFVDPSAIKRTINEARQMERRAEMRAKAKDPEEISRRENEQARQDAQVERQRAKAAAEQERESQKAHAAAERIGAMLGDHLPEFQALMSEFGSYGLVQVMQAIKAHKVESTAP